MEDLGKAPAYTEADIRDALTELGRRAPGADDVLSGLREAGSHRQRRSPRLPSQPRPAGPGRVLTPRLGWQQLAVGAAAAVTAAAVTLALTQAGGSPSRTGGPDAFPALPNPPASAVSPPVVVYPGHHPSGASLAKAMLTAFNAAANDVAYATEADFRAGHLIGDDRTWSWPALPKPGQLQYNRDAASIIPRGASQATGSVKLTEDNGYTTVVPRPSRYGQKEPARVITVCYAGTGQTGCGWSRLDTPAGTWSQQTGVMPFLDFRPSPRGVGLARQIAGGQWRIVGHTQLRGQRAIKLAQTRSGTWDGGNRVFLWVSEATYLPLRMTWGFQPYTETDNWYYLPPSKANLAHLRVPIPPGYPRSG
jgi:hypothetical protein